MKEKLSALVDGELSCHQQSTVLALLKGAPDLQGSWQRYHLISDILQRKGEDKRKSFNLGLSSRVLSFLAGTELIFPRAALNSKAAKDEGSECCISPPISIMNPNN